MEEHDNGEDSQHSSDEEECEFVSRLDPAERSLRDLRRVVKAFRPALKQYEDVVTSSRGSLSKALEANAQEATLKRSLQYTPAPNDDSDETRELVSMYTDEEAFTRATLRVLNLGAGNTGVLGLTADKMRQAGRLALQEDMKHETNERAMRVGLLSRQVPSHGLNNAIVPFLSKIAEFGPLIDWEIAFVRLLVRGMTIDQLRKTLSQAARVDRQFLEALLLAGNSPASRLLSTEAETARAHWQS